MRSSEHGHLSAVPHLGRRSAISSTAASLVDSWSTLLSVVGRARARRTFVNLSPKCEPQLGKRGLYNVVGGTSVKQLEMAMLWVLNLSDGRSSLLDIAQRSGMAFDTIKDAADLLAAHDLLAPVQDPRPA